MDYHIDPKIFGINWPSRFHVALHPRFSEQNDELDDQSDQSTGWMPTNGCSTSKSRTIATRTTGTTVAMRALNMPSPDTDQIQYLRAHLAHREVQLQHVRSERATHFVQEKNYLHTCVYSAAKLKIGSPEWSAMQNKHWSKNPQKQLVR